MTQQIRNPENVDLLSVDFQKRYEANFAAGNIVSLLRMIPGLRGAWVASGFDSAGDIPDVSNQGRTVTKNGNPLFSFEGLAPIVTLDGTGDYFERADEAGLDITGTETDVASAKRGLTIGGWFRPSDLTNYQFLMSKWNTGTNNESYALWYRIAGGPPGNNFVFSITTDGITDFYIDSSDYTIAMNNWYFIVGSFDPSTSLNIYVNKTKSSVLVGVPASIHSGAADFLIGDSDDLGVEFWGDFSFGFLSAMFLSDTVIYNLYHQSRALFGV